MDQAERSRRIAELAYRMWRDDGFPEGRDFVHWLEAERRIDQEYAAEDRAKSPQQSRDTRLNGAKSS